VIAAQETLFGLRDRRIWNDQLTTSMPFRPSIRVRDASWFPKREQSSLLTHIAATASGSLCVRMKSWLRLWNLNWRFAARTWEPSPWVAALFHTV